MSRYFLQWQHVVAPEEQGPAWMQWECEADVGPRLQLVRQAVMPATRAVDSVGKAAVLGQLLSQEAAEVPRRAKEALEELPSLRTSGGRQARAAAIPVQGAAATPQGAAEAQGEQPAPAARQCRLRAVAPLRPRGPAQATVHWPTVRRASLAP